ncbi:sugar phosphate/phosphate translocator [Vigna angularis]|uniref:Sugar phosphate/phosphate translocator n=2 Tax=Phaseolus angularis TaxID=3914 RepID=A0A8T0K473_PHAAN|nr:probable sugar phosphate/phosphate translocator At1g06470 [Vigna angularis]XP_017436638.1 probable sugar phosphate/phosphate translocator At1g06470 [Vigna angularis]XP_017436639.1 probable sugar phosphate/phosphate translocator At1g06470 [Vigna angularis]XP_017436640.1 probable sugar phosphate/phosphate translocator At1g06470 [Vigna angularis]XP_017436641.1 probable sugar phosphate/phosphate translocator At1g06470 [Vigna angularis]XP_017436643.1 probable sugar phosphate/phosphate translocat
MVQSELGSENGVTGVDDVGLESLGLGIRRELSFSRWCDDDDGDGSIHLDRELGNVDVSLAEGYDFELPIPQKNELQSKALDRERFFHQKFQQRSMQTNGIGTMDDDFVHRRGNGPEKYVSFDIEDKSEGGTNGVDSYISGDVDESLDKSSQNPINLANILKTLFLILMWYTFSLFLTVYNKSLLGDHMGKFPAPFLMNTIHFTMQAAFSRFITWFWSHRFETKVVVSWRDYFLRVVPTAFGTAMDINLSNASLVFISVTFATMCKSAAPIFLLLFAFAFRLETPSFRLSGIILIISFGILLTVSKETEFDFWGFVLVMLAAVMSGFRWCMTQILLQKEAYGLKNPITLMSYVTPVMAVATALLSLALDPWDEFRENQYFDNSVHITRSCLLMLLGGSIAFLMVLTEYVLISVTSAVTVTIAGVVKEAVTILVAVLYFHDRFTWLKAYGLLIILVGVSLFNWYKYLKLRKGHAGGSDMAEPSIDSAAKYVILEEMDEQEDII